MFLGEGIHSAEATRRIAALRLTIGAAQRGALYVLYHAADTHVWPATSGRWRSVGLPGPLWSCAAVLKELKLGRVSITTPAPPKFRDVNVKGALLTIMQPYDQTPSCPD